MCVTTHKPMQLCVTSPLIHYNMLVFVTILKTMCAPCETCMCKCDTLPRVSVFLCVTTSQATGYVPWCVWVPRSPCMYGRLSPGTWHIPPVASWKSPHVLTLSFFLLLTPTLLSPQGSFLETGTLGGEVENWASCGVGCLPPKCALVSWGQTEAIPARSSGGSHGQGQWKSMAELGSNSTTHHTCRDLGKPRALCLSFSCLFLELL